MRYLFLLVFWIILCEKISFEVLIIGMILSFVIHYINNRVFTFMQFCNFFKLQNCIIYIKFFILLIKEIFIANIHVAMVILSPNINTSPCLIKFKTNLKTDMSKAILANSITLTPGTITVDVNGDEFTVHCLNEDYGKSLSNSGFEKLLFELETK